MPAFWPWPREAEAGDREEAVDVGLLVDEEVMLDRLAARRRVRSAVAPGGRVIRLMMIALVLVRARSRSAGARTAAP